MPVFYLFPLLALLILSCNNSATSIKDLNGNLIDATQYKATVYFFLLPDCPLSESYLSEINQISKSYNTDEIFCCQVYPGKYYTIDVVKSFVSKNKIEMPVIFDSDNQIVLKIGATTCPQVIVQNNVGEIVYSGKIDNKATDLGQVKMEANQFYLIDAINAVVNNQEVKIKSTQPVGCVIEQ